MTPSLLLDTCAALWLMGDAPMSHEAVEAIDRAGDHGQTIYVSPITAWEIGNLARKGRFTPNMAPHRWWERLLTGHGVQPCAMPPEVLLELAFLPGSPPNDPADRIIAATAREYGYVVLTRDRALLGYGEQGHIRALAC